MLNSSVIAQLNDVLNVNIQGHVALHGGDINHTYKLALNSGDSLVIKVNNLSKYPAMFQKEKLGLLEMAKVDGVNVPKVLCVLDFEDVSILVLEYIDEGSRTSDTQAQLGQMIARLHSRKGSEFGLTTHNYIGSLQQDNTAHATWAQFYGECRLKMMLEMAFERHALPSESIKQMDKLCTNLESIFPKCHPSLLHGDLWNGNVMQSNKRDWYLIDPAVYYGHPEMDLGMMKLFGGFDASCFEAYASNSDIDSGWESRIQFTQLYPLLVHVNLFGMGYWSSVEKVLRQF